MVGRPFQTVHTAQVMPWQGAGEAAPRRVRWETRLEERAPAPAQRIGRKPILQAHEHSQLKGLNNGRLYTGMIDLSDIL